MSYTLKSALPEDAEEIALIMRATVPLLPRIQVEYKNVPADESLGLNTANLRSDFETCARFPEELCALKAVTVVDGGREEIAGYAIWGWSVSAMSLLSEAKTNIPYPKSGNADLHSAFYTRLRAMEAAHKPKGHFFSLLFLLTSPNHQRRGVGQLLVNYGLSKAGLITSPSSPNSAVPVYLSASPMGLPLYQKLGFKELARMELDLGEYGWDGEDKTERVHVHVAMIKEAVTREKKDP